MSIDPDRLMAFVDGELEPADREAVERALGADPALREEVDRQRRLKARLGAHFGPVARAAVPERLLATLGAPPPQGVVTLASARARRTGRPSWTGLGAIAASLVVGVIAGQVAPSFRGRDPISVADRGLVAEGSLAQLLDTQLAATQARDAATRVGLTFADRRGRACRTFAGRAFAGLACRSDGKWVLVATEAAGSESAGEYRQAGSPELMEKAQEMMAGAPLDSEGERAARDAGWRIAPAAGK